MEGRGLSADRNAHAHNPDARSTSAGSRSPPLAHYSRTRRTPPLSRPGPPEGPARTRRNRTGRWHWPAPARTSVRPPHDGVSCLGTGGTNPGFAPTSSSPDTASRPAPSAPPSVARAGPAAKPGPEARGRLAPSASGQESFLAGEAGTRSPGRRSRCRNSPAPWPPATVAGHSGNPPPSGSG